MHPFLLTLSIAVFGQVATPGLQEATDKTDTDFERAQKLKWDEFYKEEAAQLSIMLAGDPDKVLKLRPEPVLLWSNPIRRGDTKGAVFVWTYEGRAEGVGTVFSFLARDIPGKRQVRHSFHSLAMQPLDAKRDGRDVWSIKVPGVKFEPIAKAPAPAKTTALRLSQMRDLAREFSATTTLEGVDQELRLLPQPLYRYEKASRGVVDGALFTFVTGTDPELMLVIEARGSADDAAWHFGAGRFTDLTLKLRHNQDLIWTYEQGLPNTGTTPYMSLNTVLVDAILP